MNAKSVPWAICRILAKIVFIPKSEERATPLLKIIDRKSDVFSFENAGEIG